MRASVWQSLAGVTCRYPYLFASGATPAVAAGLFLRAAAYGARVAGWLPTVDVPTLDLVFFACGTLSIPALTLGAVMMANAETIARLLSRADTALYAAKSAGRNRVMAATGGRHGTERRRA